MDFGRVPSSVGALPWVAVAAIVLGGTVDASPRVVYDSTNFVTAGATGYGYTGVTSLDKSAIFGDALHLAATGKLTSFTWAAYNGAGSAAAVTSASETISFYRQSDGSFIGSFDATITDLGVGSFKTFTADLTSANIVLDTPDVLVTQQIPFWPPASTYRMGIVVSTASNTPAIGTTNTGFYRSQFGSQGTFVTAPNYGSSSSAVYQAAVLPNLTWNTGSGTWNDTTASWTLGPDGGNTVFSDGDQAGFDSASGGFIQLAGALAPRAVVVSAASGFYGFLSSAGNQLVGTATLSKSGGGTLGLYGPNTYSGVTTVSGGKLLVEGSLANSAVIVGSGGTLGGGGSIGALVTVQSGGVLSPGNSPGALAAAALDLQAGSETFMEIVGSGASAGTAGTDYDQLRVTSGSLTYGGDLVLSFLGNPLFGVGTSFTLFDFNGVPVGGFDGVTTAAGTSTYSGKTFQHHADGTWRTSYTSAGQYLAFDPGTGRLSVVPEPSTVGMGVVGIALAAWAARRRRG